MILEGTSYADVAKRFRSKDGKWRAGNYLTIKKHWEAQHMVSRQLLAAKDIKDRKKGLDLMECAREIYNDCKDNATKSKGKAESSRDFRDASGCWDPATKALGLLKVEEKPQLSQTTTINNFSKLTDEELKTYELLGRKLEGSEEGESEKTST